MDLYKIYEETKNYVQDKTYSLKDRAKKLVDYYYNTEDRSDKDFDTLDLALDLLEELSKVEGLTAISTQPIQEAIHTEYGIVLKEREFTSGLTRNDIMFLFNKIGDTEAYPIEMEARVHECSVMGFISREAAEVFDYDYENSGLHDFISLILDDMDNDSENCEYEFRGVRIWLSR